MTRTTNSEAGFTLLELLVALAVLGLLTMLMFGSLQFGVQVWNRTDRTLTHSNARVLAEAALSSELSKAYPLFRADGQTSEVAFAGQPRRLSYLTPASAVPGALDAVAIVVEGQESDLTLVKHTRLELSPSKMSRKTVLLPHLRAVTFSYFGPTADGRSTTWQNEWQGRTRLPNLVQLRLQHSDGAWSDMVIAPRLTADVSCAFDPLTKSCRGR